MLTPAEEAALRDAMCIQLLEATSDPAALTRARREERERVPAYDVVPDPFLGRAQTIQPRDLIGVCARCGAWFVSPQGNRRTCSDACRSTLSARRRRAEAAA